jgi:hypothetical protein
MEALEARILGGILCAHDSASNNLFFPLEGQLFPLRNGIGERRVCRILINFKCHPDTIELPTRLDVGEYNFGDARCVPKRQS